MEDQILFVRKMQLQLLLPERRNGRNKGAAGRLLPPPAVMAALLQRDGLSTCGVDPVEVFRAAAGDMRTRHHGQALSL